MDMNMTVNRIITMSNNECESEKWVHFGVVLGLIWGLLWGLFWLVV